MISNCDLTREALREGGVDICPNCQRNFYSHDSEAIVVEKIRLKMEEARLEMKKEETRLRKEEIQLEMKKEETQLEMKKEETMLKKEEIQLEMKKMEFRLKLGSEKESSSLSASIPVLEWSQLEKIYITYQTGMSFDQFQRLIEIAFGIERKFRIYSLPPAALIEDRERLDNESFHKILKPFVSTEGKIPTIYVFLDDFSPEKLPAKMVEKKSLYSRSSTSQDSLRKMVIKRDKTCVFCEECSTTLEAAHIIDHHRADSDTIDSVDLYGVDELRNAIALCTTCHRFYDGQMLCIHPDSLTLIVCEAFIACSPLKEKYIPLNNRKIFENANSTQLPTALVLENRYKYFLEKSKERRKKNSEFPYYCWECNKNIKKSLVFQRINANGTIMLQQVHMRLETMDPLRKSKL